MTKPEVVIESGHQNETFKVVVLIGKFILNYELSTILDLDLFYFQTSQASHQRGVWCL